MTKIINEIDIKDILNTRLWFYDFLGKSFYTEPDTKRLKDISELKIFDQFYNDADIQNEGAQLLSDFFVKIPTMQEDDYKSLKDEYTRLFIGPGHLPTPPWESVYLSREGIILDEHTLAVREFYKKWGVSTKLQGSSREPDDHIGFELEFMSVLTDKGLRALEENNLDELKKILTAQRQFLQSHLLVWVGEFSSKLVNSTREKFYKGLGLFLLDYLEMDNELLQDLLSNLDDLIS